MLKKVLVVDDEIDIVHAIKVVLVKEGFEVMSASDGKQALELLKSYEPDLMIFDLTMPHLNGWRLSMKVREDKRFERIPIIILSGLIENEHEPKKFEQGTLYMSKPFDVFQLLDKVKELLKDS